MIDLALCSSHVPAASSEPAIKCAVVVPKGKLHNPVADEECGLALIETVSTLHTGDVTTPLSKSIAEQLAG